MLIITTIEPDLDLPRPYNVRYHLGRPVHFRLWSGKQGSTYRDDIEYWRPGRRDEARVTDAETFYHNTAAEPGRV